MSKPSRFLATVKERERDQPCFVVIENYEDIGTAQALADFLNEKVATVSTLL